MDKFQRTTLPSRAVSVTPSDTVNVTGESVVLFVGTGGSVKVTTSGGSEVTLTNVADGSFLPLQVARVWATGTDATGILALY